jgi:hypothetical protein
MISPTEYQTNDHEDANCCQFQETGPELFLSKPENTEHIDDDNCEKEDRDPGTDIDARVPISDCEAGDYQLKR